jgi:hypothetical protein
MPRHEGGERFTVELQALADDVPPVVRLRQWLKSALRSARMRAVSVRQLPATPTPSQGGTEGAEAAAQSCEGEDTPAGR